MKNAGSVSLAAGGCAPSADDEDDLLLSVDAELELLALASLVDALAVDEAAAAVDEWETVKSTGVVHSLQSHKK